MTPNIPIHGFHIIIHKLLPAYHKITERRTVLHLFLYNRLHELRPILAKAVGVFLVHWISRFILILRRTSELAQKVVSEGRLCFEKISLFSFILGFIYLQIIKVKSLSTNWSNLWERNENLRGRVAPRIRNKEYRTRFVYIHSRFLFFRNSRP